MRALARVVGLGCILFFGIACDESSSSTVDMSGLTPAADSCAAILACNAKCTAATASTCFPACVAKGSAAAKTLYGAVNACVDAACAQGVGADGGAGPCGLDPVGAACQSCATTNCGTQIAACSAK